MAVAELVALCHERLEVGPSDWLFDFNLPDLFTAIYLLYDEMGDLDRLSIVLQNETARRST